MDSEELYSKLRQFAETLGFVNDYADEKLAEAAQAIAETTEEVE
jgi:hypothetical protein